LYVTGHVQYKYVYTNAAASFFSSVTQGQVIVAEIFFVKVEVLTCGVDVREEAL
jgi:hypothetical protein